MLLAEGAPFRRLYHDPSPALQDKSGSQSKDTGAMTRKEEVEAQDLSLVIRKDSGFPIYLQIAHQILHYVESGVLRSGSMLPSIRKLAALLRVAPLTIDEAYRWLGTRGIVTSEKGVGFRIAVEFNGSKENQLRRAAMADFVEQSLSRCQREGFDPVMFAHAVMARAGVQDRKTRDLVFVECQPEYVREYTNELKNEFDSSVKVSGMLVSSLPAKLTSNTPEGRRLLGAEFIATTLYHYDQLRKLLAPLKRTVLTLSHTLDKDALRHMAALSPGTRLGVILGPVDPATTMVHTIEQYEGLATGSIPYASIDDEDAVLKVIRQSDVIAYTASCERLIRKLRLKRSKLILMRFVPDEEAIRKVKALLSPT